ncbi:unnamed protein product [Darwinula stevensoni]|uniref:Small ribosomal subunit protein uS7 domain-containing protein n=1 Tax=Darwinula stevensoni TaxID=69355 RepID=A0A7R8X594_9CRUS|nr:unnamed protein product [Darwinula stevensoni]CAG0880672.1 unnamed protein product [Darwinula stevensoni]
MRFLQRTLKVLLTASKGTLPASADATPIPLRWSTLKVLKRYSVFPAHWPQPVYRPEEQEKLTGTGEIEELSFIPVRPARSTDTSSVFHDPRVNIQSNPQAFKEVKRIQLEKYHKASEEEKRGIELNPQRIFHGAIDNCKPILALIPLKRGGVTYQVPLGVTEKKSEWMACKWLILAARDKHRRVHFPQQLATELIDAFHSEGRVVKRKQELHRQAEANRAYAHYRWR